MAEFLWGAFGPKTDAWGNKPRPFGSAAVDGFDLDLEAHMSPEPFPTYKWANYARFVNHLTTNLFPKGPLPKYYISGAPQCLSPDERLADAIKNSNFDFIFTQFYNTNGCSARDGYNGLNKGSTTFTFDAWVAWLNANSKNKGVKLYLGLVRLAFPFFAATSTDESTACRCCWSWCSLPPPLPDSNRSQRPGLLLPEETQQHLRRCNALGSHCFREEQEVWQGLHDLDQGDSLRKVDRQDLH